MSELVNEVFGSGSVTLVMNRIKAQSKTPVSFMASDIHCKGASIFTSVGEYLILLGCF